jgi:MFS transporter, DHA2 family, multidrug resistance protein
LSTHDPHADWIPRHNPWAIALTVTMATFMEVLDTSIANVALPHIAGSLSASQDESTWVLTSYLVSNAMVLPVSAWLANRFGRKRFYMSCVALFTISSALCGLAPSLGLLVFFRVLQGLGGGGLAPSEQAILADTFPPAMRGIAFAVYGMAVVCAPAIGPTLGGWITDNFAWNWIFYINVPVGILSLYLTNRLVDDPPYLKQEREKSKHIGVDYIGLGLIAVGIGALQIVLDKGQEADWFDSRWITTLFTIAILTLITWVWWEWNHKDPIVNVRLFQRRNFATAMVFTFALGIVLYGTTFVIPQFLQSMLGYSAVKAGEAISGGGLMMMVMMPIAGIMVSRVDPRYMMVAGFGMTALSLFHMSTHLTLGIDFGTAAMLRVYQTVGLAFIFIPSNTLAYVGVPRTQNNQVSGMNAFVRNIGGSIGIAIISTFLSRLEQKHQTYMVANARPGNPAFDSLVKTMSGDGSHQIAYARIYRMVQAQATTLAYVDIVTIMAIVVACLIPLVFLMKRGGPPPKGETAMH